MTDQDPNALRERELAAWWKTIALRKRNAVHAHTAFCSGWDRAWSKCSEVAEVSIRELTAELEALKSREDTFLAGRLATQERELSQLRATVERQINLLRRWLADEDHADDGIVRSDTERELGIDPAKSSAAPDPAVHDVHEEGDCRYAESLIEQLDEALCTLLHSGDELGEHSPESHLELFHEQQRDIVAAPAPAAPDVHIAVSPEAVDEVLECDALKARVDELAEELEAERSTSKALRHELSRDMSASGELQLDAARTELSQLRATVGQLDGRRREGRQLLRRFTKYAREDCAVTPGVTRLARLASEVDDYLRRTEDPNDILRATPAPAAPDGWEAVYKQEHQLRREIGAERDALRARVAELEGALASLVASSVAHVAELEGALNRVVQTTDSGSRALQIALEALPARNQPRGV